MVRREPGAANTNGSFCTSLLFGPPLVKTEILDLRRVTRAAEGRESFGFNAERVCNADIAQQVAEGLMYVRIARPSICVMRGSNKIVKRNQYYCSKCRSCWYLTANSGRDDLFRLRA